MGSSQEAFTESPRLTLTKSNKTASQTEPFRSKKLKKFTNPEIKGKAGYKEKSNAAFFYCTQKGTLLSSYHGNRRLNVANIQTRQ
jgi:hypothetical protein